MITNRKSVLLADDDADDREMFGDALMEITNDVKLTEASDGKILMEILDETVPPAPDVIFLDLNMPLKNGFECLAEIRATKKLKDIPVVIYSTSSEKEFIDRVYEQGADYYICKPGSYQQLKSAIGSVLNIDWKNHAQQPPRDRFVLS